MRGFVFSLFFLAVSGAQASWWRAIEKNNDGVKKLEQDMNLDAHNQFIGALSEDPFMAEIHINLGLTFEKNKEPEKALSEYVLALEGAKTPATAFYASFNAARVLGEMQKYGEALSLYQSALEIRPESLEVKTNIELLIQQMQQQQQQGGGGGKDDKDKKKDEKKDNKSDDDQDGDREGERINRREQEPKPFESQHLTKQDVDKILEELKNQEQKIRMQQNQKSGKETPHEKDW